MAKMTEYNPTTFMIRKKNGAKLNNIYYTGKTDEFTYTCKIIFLYVNIP